MSPNDETKSLSIRMAPGPQPNIEWHKWISEIHAKMLAECAEQARARGLLIIDYGIESRRDMYLDDGTITLQCTVAPPCDHCRQPVRTTLDSDAYDPREYPWVHMDGELVCDNGHLGERTGEWHDTTVADIEGWMKVHSADETSADFDA